MKKRTIAAAGIALGVMVILAGCVFIGNIHPVASFIATPSSGTGPQLTVSFDASTSSDADGTIVSYYWDFDDDQTASFVTPAAAHQFTIQSVSQTFRVMLIVTDNLGAEDQAVVDVTVNP